MAPETEVTTTEPTGPPPDANVGIPANKAGDKVLTITKAAQKKGNIYYLDPDDVVVPKDMNGRRFQGSDIMDLVREFLDPAIGQLEPIGVRQTKDGPAVAYGFRRLEAAQTINENRLHGSKPPFLIACVSVTGSDDETFIKNVLENHQRKSLSPIDTAYVMDRMITEFGKNREEVAKLFAIGNKPRSQAWVTQTLKLLKLPSDVQKKVHSGDIGVAAAYELADAPEETQKEAAKSKGKVTVAAVQESKREAKEAKSTKDKASGKDEEPATVKVGRPPKEQRGRTRKEIQVFFTQLEKFWTTEEKNGRAYEFETFPKAKELDPEGTVKELGKQLLKWLEGHGTNKAMARQLLKFGGMVD